PARANVDEGRWVVILGENGMGKTTLLRALVFVLAGGSIPDTILGSSSARLLRAGAKSGDVSVTVGAHTVGVRVKLGEAGAMLEHVGELPPRRPFVFAYGARRGSALGGAQREVSFTPLGEVVTLFDEGVGLIHAETWLTKLRLAAALGQENKDDR